MKTLNFKHAIEKLGYKVEKYIYGYNFRSAFASKDGQLWYFHIEDLRDDHPFVYRRTVKSLEDYTVEVIEMMLNIFLKTWDIR